MNSAPKLISVVIPVYNEESNVDILIKRLCAVFKNLNSPYEIIFSADPCTDNTLQIILKHRSENPSIKLLVMSRRFGQPAATIAGLKVSTGDCVVIMDADLQDPPEVITDMVSKYVSGFDVVHARRAKRLGESKIRLVITHVGYYVINKLSSTYIPRNVGEFKMLSRRVVDSMLELGEANIFIKGLVSYVGFKQGMIEYVRDARFAGAAHYSQLWGSIPLALNGIYCYSNKPLHVISLIGFFSSSVSFSLIVIFLVAKLIGLPFASGIVTLAILLSFFSGLILFSIGVLGEYVGRIFNEVKGRPIYIIAEKYL